MYDESYRIEMKELLEVGLSKTAIARQLGVNRRTITRWAAEKEKPPRKVRLQKLDPYKEMIQMHLKVDPDLTAIRLFELAKEMGYDGSYTRVRDFVRQHRIRVEKSVP